MDFSNSVIIPREDFVELQEAAWAQLPQSIKDRALNTVQTTIICAALSGIVVAGTWGWVKAVDWKSKRDFDRKVALIHAQDNTQK